MSLFGKALLMEAQRNFSEGQVPDSKILHRVLMFLGGFLIFLPGVISDLLGVLLILPGFRHLLVIYFRIYLAKSINRGSFRFFKMGAGGFAFRGGFGGSQGASDSQLERDAKVIDVEVLESSKNKLE